LIRPLVAGLAAVLLLASPAASDESDTRASPDWLKTLRVRGRLKEEFAYRLKDPGDASKIRTLGWLDAKYAFSESANLRLETRGWWDGVFEATDRYPRNVKRDLETDLSLRQALLSISSGPLDVRLGRQQIVWGEAIGTFITDVVNPKDFREFILPDFTELRIPIWAVNATYHLAEGLNVEGVWTPDTRSNKIGKQGSEFQFQPPRYRFGRPVVRLPDRQDEFSLERSEGGFRFSWLVQGWDLSLIYYDAADKTAVLHQRRDGSAVVLEPRHERLHIVGATLAKSIEPVVIRSEAALTVGKRYETTDPLDPDGVVRRDTFDYLVGMDYTFFEKLDMALQFSQKILTGSATNLTRGAVEARVTSSVAFRMTTGFFDNTLNPTVLWVVNANRGDYRFSPKIEYLPAGSVTVTLGADIFAGSVDTLYGQFHSNDRVYLDVSWKF
jgi:hypothetical protein